MNQCRFGIVLAEVWVMPTIPYLSNFKLPYGTLIQFDQRDQFSFGFVTGRIVFPDEDVPFSSIGLVFYIKLNDVLEITLGVLEFCLAIRNKTDRVLFCLEDQHQNFLENLEPGSDVLYFNDGYSIPAKVKYIGSVREKGPGIYIGIEMMAHRYNFDGYNFEILNYFPDCDPFKCVLTTADKIKPFEKYTGNLSLLSNLTSKCSMNHQQQINNTNPQLNQTQTNEIDSSNSLTNRVLHEIDQFTSSTTTKNSNRTTKSQLNAKESETETMKSNIPGILKHSKSLKIDDSIAAGSQAASTSSSSSLKVPSYFVDGREIVVVDQEFVDEKTKNQNDVTIIKTNDHMEFAQALGTSWPDEAGPISEALNNDSSKCKTYAFNVKHDRNKSPNPLSHIATRNKKRNSSESGYGSASHKGRNTYNSSYNNSSFNAQSSSDENTPPIPPTIEVSGTVLSVGSVIEVTTGICDNLFGVIKWIGKPYGSDCAMVGVELEDDLCDTPIDLTNGSFNGKRYFKCPNGRALFIEPKFCSPDNRFDDHQPSSSAAKNNAKKTFGGLDCPIVPGHVPPLKIVDLKDITGSFKGIQGHHNSCYLDATLFAMFTFTSVFDSLLYRPADNEDIARYEEVQTILRDEIVNSLRKNKFVRADRVLKFREILEEIALVTGFTTEEKDPEEFLNILFTKVLRAEPYLKLSSGQDTYCYQLFVEKDKEINFPTVQQLCEQSFFTSNIKLKEVPSCLIIQMPRFGKNFKVYSRILPSQILDVTDIIENSPRQCAICSKLASYECNKCFYEFDSGGLESTTFCDNCVKPSHQHEKRSSHTTKKIEVSPDFITVDTVPRIYMNLIAVVCIETSHYVSFVKSGPSTNDPWCFFDSMSDRKGGQSGYNIPKVIPVEEISMWLTEEGFKELNQTSVNDKCLPEHAKRLLCDAYMCIYQSPDVMMYK